MQSDARASKTVAPRRGATVACLCAGVILLPIMGAMLRMVSVPSIFAGHAQGVRLAGGVADAAAGSVMSILAGSGAHSPISNDMLIYSMPTMGIIGLCIVALACALAGVFIIMRKG
jgi:hypothetical protein